YVSFVNEHNRLFRNIGPAGSSRSRFEDVTAKAAAAGPVFSFPTWFWDYDNDGWLDIYVADVTADQLRSPRKSVASVAADYLGVPRKAPIQSLLHNNGDGTF